jgi:hypothetical protein
VWWGQGASCCCAWSPAVLLRRSKLLLLQQLRLLAAACVGAICVCLHQLCVLCSCKLCVQQTLGAASGKRSSAGAVASDEVATVVLLGWRKGWPMLCLSQVSVLFAALCVLWAHSIMYGVRVVSVTSIHLHSQHCTALCCGDKAASVVQPWCRLHNHQAILTWRSNC